MNKYLSLLPLLLLGSIAYSQKTLEFNQVKLITTVETVPTGAVWKVMSAIGPSIVVRENINTYSSVSPTLPDHTILINGSPAAIATNLAYNSSYNPRGTTASSYLRQITVGKETCTQLPVWLPEGSTLATGSNVTSISVIEFLVQ